MRILMLSQFYPPFVVGGEELMVAATSRGLAARGHEVAVVTLAVEGAPPFECDEGVDIHRITSSSGRLQFLYTDVERPHVPPFPDPEVAYRVNRLIAELQPDIVHGHNWLMRSVLPLRIPATTRVVATLHDYGRICATRRLMRDGTPCEGPGVARCLRCARAHYGLVKGFVTAATNAGGSRWEHHKVDLYLAISEAVADRSGLAELRVPHRVISNFLPDEFPDGEPVVAPTPDDGPIVFVGDAVHDKGIETLLEAYAALADPPELVLVGREGDLGDRGLPPGVRRAGLVPYEGVGAFWRAASIAVVPSLWPEPFGLVALEAAAYGRPLVASRTGGLVDLVLDGQSGLLVPPGDAPALAAALGRLLDDPALARRMGLAGLQHSRSFRASSVLPRLEAAYSEVLAA